MFDTPVLLFKTAMTLMVLVFCTASAQAQPSCLPAALALSTTPAGMPVSANTYWPTVSDAPIQDGLAMFWYCNGGRDTQVFELHTTPSALARAGGLQALQSRYLHDKDAAWAELNAVGHSCLEADPDPSSLAKRPDCFGFQATRSHATRYLCLNPGVTELHEVKLCKHLLADMAAHWPQ
ncbi:MAG: hypothetical protein QM749_19690 [Aquabacterium sp.]